MQLAGLNRDEVPMNFLIPQPGTPYENYEIVEGRDALRTVAADVVRPAGQRYRDAIAADRVPHGRDDPHAGLCSLTRGDEVYRERARPPTSLDIDHDKGHTSGREHTAGPSADDRVDHRQRVQGVAGNRAGSGAHHLLGGAIRTGRTARQPIRVQPA